MRPVASDHSLAARLLALALLVGVLGNGASVYLKRTGLMDPDAYRAYWSIHCRSTDPATAIAPAEPRCCARATAEDFESHESEAYSELERKFQRYVFEPSRSDLALKLGKDLFGLAMIAFSLSLVARRAAPAPAMRDTWPVSLLLGYVLISFLASLFLNGPLVAALGLRAFMFAMIALVALWLAPHFGAVARCLGALLVVQALLIPFELFRGIHLYGEWTPLSLASRASATMVQPNSLGVFAVASLAFLYSFSPTRRWFAPLGVVTLACVLASGSGTGIVCMAVIAFSILRENTPAARRDLAAIAGFATVLILILALPFVSGREDILDSILGNGGRVHHILAALMQRGSLETMFGSGLGTGSNAAWMLVYQTSSQGAGVPSPYESFRADSTIAALVVQIGAVGTLLFYATLLWAALHDRPGRLFYAIIALCSLTLNVTELFPVNFLLGIALARSAWKMRHE